MVRELARKQALSTADNADGADGETHSIFRVIVTVRCQTVWNRAKMTKPNELVQSLVTTERDGYGYTTVL